MVLIFSHYMRNGTPHLASLGRALDMLEAVIADGGQSSISAIARQLEVPVATAHRQVATLVAERILKSGRGTRLMAGPRLLNLLRHVDEKQMIANVAAPVLNQLAITLGSVVQLGTFENDMVTYRIKTGIGAKSLLSKVGMQLEAYCSAIGKVLLANLNEDERRHYLAAGPFVALTRKTITNPALLAEELERVRAQGFAVDDGEIADGVFCVAVPVESPSGGAPAAISVSQIGGSARIRPPEEILPQLRLAAQTVAHQAYGTPALSGQRSQYS